jgi:hypothetical protein
MAGLAARIIFAYAFSSGLGADALPLAEALSWFVAVAADLCGLIYFRVKGDRTEE